LSLVSSTLPWYGGVISPLELLGPSRYQWDNSYFSQEIDRKIKIISEKFLIKVAFFWNNLNDKLLIYDYLGSNLAKGGIFRTGPSHRGDSMVQN